MEDPAIKELRIRLARGEIKPDEYERLRAMLHHDEPTQFSPKAPTTPTTPSAVSAPFKTNKPLFVGATLLLCALAAAIFSFTPWFSDSGITLNPWFASGSGETIWWLGAGDDLGTGQGFDLIQWSGPAIAIGLLLTLGGAAAVLIERRIRVPSVILVTIGLGVYASAAALSLVVAAKNDIGMGTWSIGIWGSIIATLGMLAAGAVFTPDKTPR